MRVVILCLLILFMSCSSSKNMLTEEETSSFKKRVENKKFEVISEWAQPMGMSFGVTGLQNLLPPGSTLNNINLIGNTNFFRVNKDSIHMDLPYFGQRRMSTGYNSDGSLKFNGKAATKETNLYQKKKSYVLEYELKAKNEYFNIILTLYANHSSSLLVNSSHRTSISYKGYWQEIINKE